MDDREMLERAAKAADVDILWGTIYDGRERHEYSYKPHGPGWNPLRSPADCFALETACDFHIAPSELGIHVWKWEPRGISAVEYWAEHPDKLSARMRASVRCAAMMSQAGMGKGKR